MTHSEIAHRIIFETCGNTPAHIVLRECALGVLHANEYKSYKEVKQAIDLMQTSDADEIQASALAFIIGIHIGLWDASDITKHMIIKHVTEYLNTRNWLSTILTNDKNKQLNPYNVAKIFSTNVGLICIDNHFDYVINKVPGIIGTGYIVHTDVAKLLAKQI